MIAVVCGVAVVVLMTTMAVDVVRAPNREIGVGDFMGHLVLWLVVGFFANIVTMRLHSDVQTMTPIVLGMIAVAAAGQRSMIAVVTPFVMVIVGFLLARLVTASADAPWVWVGAAFVLSACIIGLALRRKSTSNR